MGKQTISKLLLPAFIIIMTMACSGDKSLEGSVHEFRLDNGMKWFLVKRGYAPIFAGVVRVKVGGADEVVGTRGLAHFLEHMAFKGTSRIGTTDFEAERKIIEELDRFFEEKKGLAKTEAPSQDKLKEIDEKIKALTEEEKKYIVPNAIFDIFTRNGTPGLNAYTNKDGTTYLAEMPQPKLELWMFMMSEMLKDPAFREFYTEKDVILEELRSSIDNDPEGKAFDALLTNAYDRSPYKWLTIGTKEDVENLNRKDLKDFYNKTYTAECMTGSIVGDIDIEETKQLIKKYFGSFKGAANICNRVLEMNPPQREPKDVEVTFDAEPMLIIGFHKPRAPNFDDFVFDIIGAVLCGGESSRMTRDLVQDKKLARQVACFNTFPGNRLDNLFIIYAEPYGAETMDELKDAILAELQGLIDKPMTEGEFLKVKNQVEASLLMSIDTNYELAERLVDAEDVIGTWHYPFAHPKNIAGITVSDVVNTAKKYFVPENSTIVRLRREKGNEAKTN